MDVKEQPSVQQDLEKLFVSTKGGGRGDESREIHRVGAGESSASITTDSNTSFATPFTTKRTLWRFDAPYFTWHKLFFGMILR